MGGPRAALWQTALAAQCIPGAVAAGFKRTGQRCDGRTFALIDGKPSDPMWHRATRTSYIFSRFVVNYFCVAGHADVSPPEGRLFPRKLSAVGGRGEYVDGQQGRSDRLSAWPRIRFNVFLGRCVDESLPEKSSRAMALHAVFWRSAIWSLARVSDTALDELLGLGRLLKEIGTL